MTLSEFCYKSKRKMYGYYFRHIRKKVFANYCACYVSYRHSLKFQGECVPRGNLGLRFAHIPFSNMRHIDLPEAFLALVSGFPRLDNGR